VPGEQHRAVSRQAGDPSGDQRGQSGLEDTENEMTVAAGNAEHDALMLLAVTRPSKPHAVARSEAGLGSSRSIGIAGVTTDR